MTEQDIKRLENIAIERMKKGFTREEALQSLRNAGILDENNNYTEPYQNLGRAIEASKKSTFEKNIFKKSSFAGSVPENTAAPSTYRPHPTNLCSKLTLNSYLVAF